METKFTKSITEPFKTLGNKTFGKLYFAQAASLFGDAFTWLGLALLTYQISPEKSAIILASALTLRVTAYIVFSPFAGVVSDKFPRKKILLITQFFRMVIVSLLPFVTQEWQIYGLIFFLNIFSAFFMPTYRAIIPQVVEKEQYREANGLSMATFQMLSVFGPGLAGLTTVWLGAQQIFFVNGITLLIAILLIISIPFSELQKGVNAENAANDKAWRNVLKGVKLLFGNKIIRFALSIEFISAIAGAMILVNTVGLVKTSLALDDKHYGWVMAAFGVGGAITAFLLGSLDKSKTRSISLISGAMMIGITISVANFVPFEGLMLLWVLAGIGQTLADMPSETLIGENIEPQDQGKVYGSHFAFSHLWWAIAYPIAGFVGTKFRGTDFLYGGLLTITIVILAIVLLKPFKNQD
ncbi:MFS transporter [Flavobacterium sp.]|jgi:NRE family putative nickel resistance protein-like MFS transporter|uniref:MFS transporter n=1 Tax=Flavobacteriales TaxID=200644 RepID=UPI0021A661FD|nr:MFS transporter [Flavobacterium sp.]MCT4317748.1 MFS transporter [Elizabethkingia anophelis]MDG2433556.1 MFS transporter [Flavobacterium sp.]MDV4069917.1 MFS transporter [Elizabethkingia anophelis]|tara:strand:+ start:24671 stop:25903 length:1233 start_codon:yes stop_codon:yes gene_type:complete